VLGYTVEGRLVEGKLRFFSTTDNVEIHPASYSVDNGDNINGDKAA
jgi:hypothetical protein